MYSGILLLFAHWIGDYLFQTNEMATSKGRSFYWLNVHVAVYTLPILASALMLFPWDIALYFALLNALFHWITDFVTTRLAYRYQSNPRLFYPIIGFDQFTHGACLLGTLLYFE